MNDETDGMAWSCWKSSKRTEHDDRSLAVFSVRNYPLPRIPTSHSHIRIRNSDVGKFKIQYIIALINI